MRGGAVNASLVVVGRSDQPATNYYVVTVEVFGAGFFGAKSGALCWR